MFKYLLSFVLILSYGYAEESKFVLLLGPSGVGKSTLIHHLKEMDSRFVYVTPLTTRELRPGEVDKIHVSLETINKLELEGKLLAVNEIYGIYYATPKEIIDIALKEEKYPILDWPVDKMDIMLSHYRNNLFTIYVEPENIESLKERLDQDARDKEGKRFQAGTKELEKYYQGDFDELINLKVINYQGGDWQIALQIYDILSL